jgi:hypothetical protein
MRVTPGRAGSPWPAQRRKADMKIGTALFWLGLFGLAAYLVTITR